MRSLSDQVNTDYRSQAEPPAATVNTVCRVPNQGLAVRRPAVGATHRSIGSYEPYATSHEGLYRETGVQEEARM
jgi:hypothetical protein